MKIIKKIRTSIQNYFQKDDESFLENPLINSKEYIKTKEIEHSGWSNGKMIKFWLFALLVGLLGYFVYNASSFIFMIIAAYVVSMIVETFILFFETLGLKRSLSIFVSYFLFVLFLFLIFLTVVPFLAGQVTNLITIGMNYLIDFQRGLSVEGIYETIINIKVLPEYWENYLLNNVGNEQFWLQLQSALQQNISNIISFGKDYVGKVWFTLMGFVSGFTNFLRKFVIFMTLSVLFSAEKKSVMRFFSRIIGSQKKDIVYFKLDKIYKRLGLWLKARLILSIFMAAALFLSLWILELFGMSIANKFSLSLVLGIFDVIPYIGPVIGSAPAVIGGLTGYGILGGIIVALIAIVINVIENIVLIPVLMGKRLGMNTIVVFVSIIFGGILMGLLGVFLAVPIAVIITLLIEDDDVSSKQIDEDIKE